MIKASTIAGVVLLALGVLWALQGLGLVGGSFMTGQSRWLVIGAITAVAGIVILVWANSRGGV